MSNTATYTSKLPAHSLHRGDVIEVDGEQGRITRHPSRDGRKLHLDLDDGRELIVDVNEPIAKVIGSRS